MPAVVIEVVRANNHIAWALQNGAESRVRPSPMLQRWGRAAAGWPADEKRLRRRRARRHSGFRAFDLGIPPWLSRRSWWVGKRICSEHHQWHALHSIGVSGRARCC